MLLCLNKLAIRPHSISFFHCASPPMFSNILAEKSPYQTPFFLKSEDGGCLQQDQSFNIFNGVVCSLTKVIPHFYRNIGRRIFWVC